jgi:hypothetical protein
MTMANIRSIRIAAGAALSAIMLLACAKPAPPAESSAEPASETAVPASESGPADSATSDPAAPPPPNEPSTMPRPQDPPAASNEPDLNSMPLARPSAKISVAADVRYQIEGPIEPGQSATLHLAVVPRIAGAPMQVTLAENAGLSIAAGPASVQKVGNRDVVRRQYAVTRSTAAANQVRVLVTMQAAEGTGFGFFTIPLEDGTPSRKLDSVKQQ